MKVLTEVSPSISYSRILFQSGTQGGDLLSTTLQHIILHISLEGAVEVLKGIHFIQGEDLNTGKARKIPLHFTCTDPIRNCRSDVGFELEMVHIVSRIWYNFFDCEHQLISAKLFVNNG